MKEENKDIWFPAKKYGIGQELTVRYFDRSEDNVPSFPVGLAVRDYE